MRQRNTSFTSFLLRNMTPGMLIYIIIALAILAGVISVVLAYTTVDVVEDVRVTGTERVYEQTSETTSDSYYLVFTEQESFKNTDSIWHLKFNSSDIQAQMQPGAVCDFEVNMWRVPLLSWYRNILAVNCD